MGYKFTFLSFQQEVISSNCFLLFKINWLLEKLKLVKMGSYFNSSGETIQKPWLKDHSERCLPQSTSAGGKENNTWICWYIGYENRKWIQNSSLCDWEDDGSVDSNEVKKERKKFRELQCLTGYFFCIRVIS